MSKCSNEDPSNTADLLIEQFQNEIFQEYPEGRVSSIKNKEKSVNSKEEYLGLRDQYSYKLNTPDDYQFREHYSGFFSES